jgi:cytochrome c oxidase assembly protein subunit 15
MWQRACAELQAPRITESVSLSERSSTAAGSLAAHSVAVVLVGATAVLLCFGALVTTYDAAMAVPDWPATYGHNMFLFPVSEWLGGPWDLFLEHGHRLLGAGVGLLSLILAAACFRWEKRGIVRGLALAAVILVVLQGVLGGMRVLLDDRTIAKVHACTGPLFFGVAIALATLTGRSSRPLLASPWLFRWSAGLVAASYLQLIAGAQLRHIDAAVVDPVTFQWLVFAHLAGAGLVVFLSVASAATAWAAAFKPPRQDCRRQAAGNELTGRFSKVTRPLIWSTAVLLLVACQIMLGAAAWLANWGIPSGWIGRIFAAWVTSPVEARSLWNASVVTGHVVLGMMIFGMAIVLWIACSHVRSEDQTSSEGGLA